MRLSASDREVLNLLQEDIPLTSQPFEILSRRIGVDEIELLKKAKALRSKGIIRSFAAHLNHRKLNYKSTLIAFRVPEDKLETFAKKMASHLEVTHCYEREGDYNLWTVFIYKNGRLKKILDDIRKEIGEDNILTLPTKRQFKLKTKLRL